MSYRGHIENGRVKFDEPVHLPEGAAVIVEIQIDDSGAQIHPDVKRFSGVLPRDIDYKAEFHDEMNKKHS